MSISVALCTYNGETYLLPQLLSIVNQLRPPDEIIVSDDHSTDNTVTILRHFATQSPIPMKISVNPQNRGINQNFQQAIEGCHGDIIALSDQDDVWSPEKLDQFEQVFEKNISVGGVFSNAMVVDHQLTPLNYSIWDVVGLGPKLVNRMAKDSALDVLLKQPVVTGATFAFRSVYRERALPIPSTWFHDAWIAFVVGSYAGLIPLPLSLVMYRQHSCNQIGGLMKSDQDRVREALRIDRTIYFDKEIDRFSLLHERLANNGATSPDVLAKISAKLQFLHCRYELPKNRLFRIERIVKNLVRKDYARYSRGWRIALQDWLMP